MFDRIIDLGCGEAKYFPENLPSALQYVGVDLIRPAWAHPISRDNMIFVKSDGMATLSHTELTENDLVIAIFSAHHIGIGNIIEFIESCKEKCPSILIVDPQIISHKSFVFQYFGSIFLSLFSIIASILKKNTNATYFVVNQLRFLACRQGVLHSYRDFKMGLPAQIRSLPKRLVHLNVGALDIWFRGDRISDWLKLK